MKKSKKEKISRIVKMIFFTGLIIWCFYLVGAIIGYDKGYDEGYVKGQNYTKETAGLRLGGDRTKNQALDKAKEYDSGGDWICVNVRNMDYDRAVEVCQHEAAHEIFAEVLETHPHKIKDVMDVIGK